MCTANLIFIREEEEEEEEEEGDRGGGRGGGEGGGEAKQHLLISLKNK